MGWEHVWAHFLDFYLCPKQPVICHPQTVHKTDYRHVRLSIWFEFVVSKNVHHSAAVREKEENESESPFVQRIA